MHFSCQGKQEKENQLIRESAATWGETLAKLKPDYDTKIYHSAKSKGRQYRPWKSNVIIHIRKTR